MKLYLKSLRFNDISSQQLLTAWTDYCYVLIFPVLFQGTRDD